MAGLAAVSQGAVAAVRGMPAAIQEEELEDEFHLQSWFVGRINTFLQAQGRILIGWDEILEGGLSPWSSRHVLAGGLPEGPLHRNCLVLLGALP